MWMEREGHSRTFEGKKLSWAIKARKPKEVRRAWKRDFCCKAIKTYSRAGNMEGISFGSLMKTSKDI